MTRVLLLAGTEEARELDGLLVRDGVDLTSSLAGVTARPAAYSGRLRRGGFGGLNGFRDYLRQETIGAVIDATHPFAATMSQTAATVCAVLAVPLLRLERPAWVVEDGWVEVDTLAAAFAALPKGATALVAAGLSAASELPGHARLVLRSIEVPAGPLPAHVTHLRARPPFALDDELALMRRHGVTHLICKNSGGLGGRTKLQAARALGVTVLMIRRPAPSVPAPARVETPMAARDWLAARVANARPGAAGRA